MKTIICPECHAETLEGSKFCCMCGRNLEQARREAEERLKKRSGELPLTRRQFTTETGEKTIEVYCHDITTFPEDIDILTLSAFYRDYLPVPRTVICALKDTRNISVMKLAEKPLMDLRESADCWLSQALPDDYAEGSVPQKGRIRRIGCVEMRTPATDFSGDPMAPLARITAYFRMLDVAAAANVEVSTIAMPILGSGSQHISKKLVVFPLIREAIDFLKRNASAKRIIFIQHSYQNAQLLADAVNDSYQLTDLETKPLSKTSRESPFVFISYASDSDGETAEMLCRILKEKGIEYWFAPERISSGDYSRPIVEGINQSTHFICLISPGSMESPHVLNEVSLAFEHVRDGMVLLPYRLDGHDSQLQPEFKYYLSRMQWHYGSPPPEEERAREFIRDVFGK